MRHIKEGTVSLLICNTEGYSQITEKKIYKDYYFIPVGCAPLPFIFCSAVIQPITNQ